MLIFNITNIFISYGVVWEIPYGINKERIQVYTIRYCEIRGYLIISLN